MTLSHSVQQDAYDWQRETFNHNLSGLCYKLREEMSELNDVIVDGTLIREEVLDECADVGILLMMIVHNFGADFLELIMNKMEINKRRTWVQLPDGRYKHVKED